MDVCIEFLVFSFLFVLCKGQGPDNWEDAWSYNNLKGPDYWGKLHSTWSMCENGNMQSPINLVSDRLIYDSNIRKIDFGYNHSGELKGNYTNTGKGPVFRPLYNDEPGSLPFRVSRGPLHYQYTLHELRVHFGQNEDEGSEHLIESFSFQGEIQLTFWNDELYSDFEKAKKSPKGLAIISIFLQDWIENKTSNMKSELAKLTSAAVLQHIIYKGSYVNLTNLNVKRLMPDTMEYITYEGSMTIPPCYETVTWVLLNRPIHISSYELIALRELLRTREGEPPRTISRNIRPPFPKGTRAIRTNIAKVYDLDEKCYQNRVEHTYAATVLT